MMPALQPMTAEMAQVAQFIKTLREVIAVQSAAALAMLTEFRLQVPR